MVTQLASVTTASPLAAGLGLLRVVGDQAEGRPVAVIVEDLHWADSASRTALATMARRLGQQPVLLLVTSRPGGDAGDGWSRLISDETHCRTIKLGPISEHQVADWAQGVGISMTTAHSARLRRHTGGHPLLVKTLLSN